MKLKIKIKRRKPFRLSVAFAQAYERNFVLLQALKKVKP